MTQGQSWRDQWQRIHRWRERVQRSRDIGRTDELGTAAYLDEVFALFQAIWHLKDWFVNDPAVSIDRTSMRTWISSDGNFLKVAHDVANGSKHMALRNGGWAGASSQTRNDATVGFDRGARHTFYITDGRTGQDHEALELADLCLGEWRTFLTSVELRPTD